MTAGGAGRRLVDALVRRLDLAAGAADCFRVGTGRGEGLVFGGLLLAQGLVAAGRTAAGAHPHALHAHFLRGGRHGVDLDWRVTRLRDGFNFATRRVDGAQAGHVIVTLTVSFVARPGEGLAHQDAIPDATAPEALEDWDAARIIGPSHRSP